MHDQCSREEHVCTGWGMGGDQRRSGSYMSNDQRPSGSYMSGESIQFSSAGEQGEVAMQAETPHSQVRSPWCILFTVGADLRVALVRVL